MDKSTNKFKIFLIISIIATILLYILVFVVNKIECSEPKTNSTNIVKNKSSELSTKITEELGSTLSKPYTDHLTSLYIYLVDTPNSELLAKSINVLNDDLEIVKSSLTPQTYSSIQNYIEQIKLADTQFQEFTKLKQTLETHLGPNLSKVVLEDLRSFALYNIFEPSQVPKMRKDLRSTLDKVSTALPEQTKNELNIILNYYK